MGRNDPIKGHDFAYSLGLKDLRVTGVDSAPEGVTALGWVSEDEKVEILQTAGCLIVPSQYEGQPMVILEALSVGCPVVASTTFLTFQTVFKALAWMTNKGGLMPCQILFLKAYKKLLKCIKSKL